jgi:hypothetical protein
VPLESGKVTEGRLITAGGQIFRNYNLTKSFPTPTSVKDGTAPHLAHISKQKLHQVFFKTTGCVLLTYRSPGFFIQKSLACARPHRGVVDVRGGYAVLSVRLSTPGRHPKTSSLDVAEGRI